MPHEWKVLSHQQVKVCFDDSEVPAILEGGPSERGAEFKIEVISSFADGLNPQL